MSPAPVFYSWQLAIDIETYYRTYGPMVYRRCRHLLRDEQEARDAMHDVFVNLLTHEGRLQHHAPSSMLFRIATNVCLNRLRTRRRRPEDPNTDILWRIASVDDHASRAGARSLLDRLFRSEPDSTRTMAVMHWLDGMTLAEVADEFGMSVSGVRKRLKRVRQRIPSLQEIDS